MADRGEIDMMTTSTTSAERKIAVPVRYHRHGDGVAAGFPQCRGEKLDDPEAERNLGDFAGVMLHGVR